tara:strand:+ start:772 stop:930 length:159 start_codon:yes stop_codon:yes gene_type:complete
MAVRTDNKEEVYSVCSGDFEHNYYLHTLEDAKIIAKELRKNGCDVRIRKVIE